MSKKMSSMSAASRCGLVGDVLVERRRPHPDVVGEPAHGEGVGAFVVEDRERGVDDLACMRAERGVPSGRAGRLNRQHRGGTPGGSGAMASSASSDAVGVDAVEELADLELPAGGGRRGARRPCRRRPARGRRGGCGGGRAAGRAGRRWRGRCAPTGRGPRGDTRYSTPSRVSRFTGTRRGSPVRRPGTSSTRLPHTLTPRRVSQATKRLNTCWVNQPGCL